MATIFPSTPTVGQVFQGYEWDGTSWNTVGVDLSADYALSSELSSHESDSTNIHGISNTADLATKTYADNAATTAASSVVDAAPSTLNTLNELAAALNDDASFATTVTTSIGTKQDKSSAMVVVNHGSTASTERPTGVGAVYWIGSVQPTNALSYDMWWEL